MAHTYTEKPPVFEARQVDQDDKESEWVVVNVNDGTERRFSNEDFKGRFQRSRAKVEPVEGLQPEESDDDSTS